MTTVSSKKSVSELQLIPKLLFFGAIVSILVVLPAATALYMKFSDILAFRIIYILALVWTLIMQIANTYIYSTVLLIPCIILSAFILTTAVAIVMFEKLQDKKESLLWSYIPLLIFYHIITSEITQTIIKKYLGKAVQAMNTLRFDVPVQGHAHTLPQYHKDANDPMLKPKKPK